MTDRHSSTQEEKEGQRHWWKMTVCTFKFKDQSRSVLSLLRRSTQWSFSASTKAVSVFWLYHVYNFNVTMLHISQEFAKWNERKTQINLDTFSQLAWLHNSCAELLWCPETLRRSLLIWRQVFFVEHMFMWVFSLFLVFLLSYSSSLDPRQTEGAPLSL